MMPGIKLVETERISKLVLSLPVHPGVEEEDLRRIAFTVLEAIKGAGS
jgi:dTDP-4-amino-4,6-dideoxygalactose transaminase